MSSTLFNQIAYSWMGLGALTFLFLFFVTAPYGRYTKKGWGTLINNRLGWVLMEITSFSIMLACALVTITNRYAIFLAVLWLTHYFYRSFIFPLRIRTRGKMIPLSIILSALFFNTINAGLNGFYLSTFASYTEDLFFQPRWYVGISLFVVGTCIHLYSDEILRGLRKPHETDYKIPQGFLFRFVSCPNFLGEIMVWSGFAILSWNVAALSFLVWTVANLLPRAVKHHAWYKSHFPEYPKNRKALIPVIL